MNVNSAIDLCTYTEQGIALLCRPANVSASIAGRLGVGLPYLLRLGNIMRDDRMILVVKG